MLQYIFPLERIKMLGEVISQIIRFIKRIKYSPCHHLLCVSTEIKSIFMDGQFRKKQQFYHSSIPVICLGNDEYLSSGFVQQNNCHVSGYHDFLCTFLLSQCVAWGQWIMAKLENWLFLKIVNGYDRIGCPVDLDLKKSKTSSSKWCNRFLT